MLSRPNRSKLVAFAIYIIAFIEVAEMALPTSAYKISFPTSKRNIAIVSNINVKDISDYERVEIIKLFNSVPLIMFKNQDIKPEEYYEFCKMFDEKHTNTVIHPFKYSCVDTVPQISLRGECVVEDMHGIKNVTLRYSDPFKNTLVWHQDIVGHGTYLPPVVSSMYMIKTPTTGGDTLFASLEDAYDNIDNNLKNRIRDYNCIYSNSKDAMMNSYFDYTGYNRVRPNNEIKFGEKGTTTLHREPLVVYSNMLRKRKCLMLSPFRFEKFDKMTTEDSLDLYRELMAKYILPKDNIVRVKWEKKDLLIFNNRKLIHSSSPTLEYKGQERLYYSCFLGTSSPIYRCSNF
jgi:taurine dioxygenase